VELNTVPVDTYSDCFMKHLESCKKCVLQSGEVMLTENKAVFFHVICVLV